MADKTKWNFPFYRKDFSNDSAEALIYFTFEITLYPKGWRFNFYSSYILLSGAPSAEFLDSPVTAMDHPFIKAFQASSSPETLTDGNEIKLRNIWNVENKNIDYFARPLSFSPLLSHFFLSFYFYIGQELRKSKKPYFFIGKKLLNLRNMRKLVIQ